MRLKVGDRVCIPKTKSKGAFALEDCGHRQEALEKGQDFLYVIKVIEKDNIVVLHIDKDGLGGNYYAVYDLEKYEKKQEVFYLNPITKFIVSEPVVVCMIYDHLTDKWHKGIAKCMEGDVFDKTKGSAIAYAKATIKMCQTHLKIMCR